MTPSVPNPAVILALPLRPNDADAATVRDYLVALLTELWDTTDGFTGKRPFGNSDWEYDLYLALTDAALVEGDNEGYPIDENHAHALIQLAITALAAPGAIIASTVPAPACLNAA